MAVNCAVVCVVSSVYRELALPPNGTPMQWRVPLGILLITVNPLTVLEPAAMARAVVLDVTLGSTSLQTAT